MTKQELKKDIIPLIGAAILVPIIEGVFGLWDMIHNRYWRSLCFVTIYTVLYLLCKYVYNKFSKK